MAAPSLDARRREAARTQSFFREVNQRIAELSQQLETPHAHIICECLDAECGATISLPLDEYSKVRADPACFVVLPGHADAEIEKTVSGHDGYLVVRKLGVAASTAAALNGQHAHDSVTRAAS